MGNCLAPRRGWLLVGNAKDVPGRGSQGWDVARAHVAAAAQRGPGAFPGSCGSVGLSPCAGFVLLPLCLPTPQKPTQGAGDSAETGAASGSWGTGQPGPSWLPLSQWGCSLPVLPPLSPYSPGALCTAPCPSWLPTMGTMRQLPPLGKAPHCPQNTETEVSLPWRCWHTRSFQELLDMGSWVGL